jgi:chemotaxis protein methyltransferase WspC
MSVVAELARLLKDTIGLDAASIGLASVERAMKERQGECGLDSPAAYRDRVLTSKVELQALVEAVVVPETWFFRDPGTFEALAAVGRAAVAHHHLPMRLLSVPSSTGEEPYAMAMALLDAGVPAEQFHVDALDVSEHALDKARHATYGKNSFRGGARLGREHHFESTPEGERVRGQVRRQVRFRAGNVLAPPLAPGIDAFDVIFCRNLLIYFDRSTQDRAIAVLGTFLKPKGLLFVGSSEGALAVAHGFTSAKLPMAFAFRKPWAGGAPAIVPAAVRPRVRRPLAVVSIPTPVPALAPAPLQAPARVPAEGGPQALDEARRLADQGRFVEAALLCESHLREQGASPDAFYLLGLVRDASGQAADAATYYRKTLYLDPKHQEAATHLALLLEQQGHAAEADVLWSRARRLAKAVGA